jgi:hypothetical protein
MSTASALLALAALAALAAPLSAQQIPELPWPVHDTTRPRPPVVAPDPVPSDATVLFDGTSLGAWRSPKGGAATWQISDGAMVAVPGTGDIETAEPLGDVQLHVEWMTPKDAKEGQNSGNSGVYLMKHYEVQVLNSYRNDTYPDGQAAALYGQYPPLVNASRAPGEWQSYDIVFRAPRFDTAGALTSPAIVTVFHNGVLVQDHVVLTGPTAHQARPPYEAHPAKLPILLQDHGEAVRYRNIWVRELKQ